MCSYLESSRSVEVAQLLKRVLLKGFREDELDDTLQKYLHINVIMREGSRITLCNDG
jgi:hypothetical protein